MNKLIKTILIVSIAILNAGLLVQPAHAAGLGVEFENGLDKPLFNETNFLPGGEITSWVKVANTSGVIQRIATQPLNITDPNRLGDVLNLVIKEGEKELYNNALSNFLANGEVYLSDLATGITTQYDFTVSFYSGAQNTFQGKSLGFDILIGFQGTEGGLLPGAGSTGGGGGGGWLPPGLTIQNEATATTTETSVTLSWTTSYPASSQIIYAEEEEKHILDLTDSMGVPPKYGYERTTPEYNISPKTTFHSVTIYGLTPGTKYYYRNVSHASLAISQEHAFITLAAPGQEPTLIASIATEQLVGEPGSGASAATPGFAGPADLTQGGLGGPVIGTSTQVTVTVEPGSPVVETPNLLLATISNFITLGTGNNIVMIVVVFLIALIIYLMINAYFVKKKK